MIGAEMIGGEWQALNALQFDAVQGPPDVWRLSPFHVDSLHRATIEVLRTALRRAAESRDVSPVGVVLQGEHGTGKTHMLGWLREQVQEQGGYFFLLQLLDAKGFWESMVTSAVGGLSHRNENGDTQLSVFLGRLAPLIDVKRIVRLAVIGGTELAREHLDAFVSGLRRLDPQLGRDAQDTLRALILLGSDDFRLQDIGEAFLYSIPESEHEGRTQWGIRPVQRTPQEIVADISRLLALTGHSVIAVDQIDTLIAQSAHATTMDNMVNLPDALVIEQVAGGLMDLREHTRRTLTVVSCLNATWEYIRNIATQTVQARFREAVQLKQIPNADVARDLVAKRVGVQFARLGFEPPYPTWPVRPSALEQAYQYTPRQLFARIDAHVQRCLINDEISELELLDQTITVERPPVSPMVEVAHFQALDTSFALLADAADIEAALDPATEDVVMPRLLHAGLTAWIAAQGDQGRAFSVDPLPNAKPPLHARLRRTLDETIEDEAHWAFRGIGATNAVAALTRIRSACVAAGLDAEVPKRRLFLLRTADWGRGKRTLEVLAEFERAGGRTLRLEPDDLKALAALRDLIATNPPHLQAWLADRKPINGVKLFNEALHDIGDLPTSIAGTGVRRPPEATPASPESGTEPPAADILSALASSGSGATPGLTAWPDLTAGPDLAVPPAGGPAAPAAETPRSLTSSGGAAPNLAWPDLATSPDVMGRPDLTMPPAADQAASTAESQRSLEQPAHPAAGRAALIDPVGFVVGRATVGGRPLPVELAALRKHTVIFAGSGSGKTVLIRRIIEECALRGVSAIVLDPNNDLARLGDAWPQPNELWEDGDDVRAADYLAGTDVVVWTPRKASGRPISFQPLPDFAAVRGDADEFLEAVDSAMAALIPRAKIDGRTEKAHLARAVLRESVIHHGREGSGGLDGLIELLADLPDEVSEVRNAHKIASALAQILIAAKVNDPLFGGDGTPVDPGVLLTPAGGKRARISVISFVGLPSDADRQSFVNQLQMALVAWIKKNPANDRPLGCLFVMDEAQTFAPSDGPATACTQSTLWLASQARKYGLGLIFATQAPKGLHNRITGNAATQFFGLLNAPAHIEAAKEVARAKGSDIGDIGHLKVGTFYAARDGSPFVKLRTPMCLSHHPAGPLTPEEVLRRARS
ncbi:helicase HerA domain-containing protein [Acrocarpospora catenulata]|uniref:helicase HerA domain-containing protein n=1 Tax=Acrocarpospora catenulata TaxID=2836182 RepID=UPI001BDB6788|nr:DUF87 domain-containing protein [Acrocarpospora catenulata]